MAFVENWGTAGTAGDYGWEFTGASAAIGTVGGTASLVLDGTGQLSNSYDYDGEGSVLANVYLDSSTSKSKTWYIKLGEANGTDVWMGLRNQDAASDFTRLYLYRDVGAGLVEVDSDSYNNWSEAGWTEWSARYDSGTWYGTLGPVVTGTTLYVQYSFDEPDTLTPTITSNGQGQNLDYLELPYSRKTILDFVGTYNDGSTTGTYNFGDDVITMGNVSEYANTPLQTRGFSAQVPVSLDDTEDIWTDFVGDMTDPSWINGTWFVRQEWNGTWTTLLTGQVNAEDVTYNVGERIVNFSVNSMLRRKAENVLGYDAHYTDGTAAGGQVTDFMTVLMELGTINGTGTDGRTITFERQTAAYIHPLGGGFTVRFHDNEYLWEGTEAEGDSVSIGSAYHKVGDENGYGSLFLESGATYSGTFTVSRLPSWMSPGAVMYYTRRWPNEVQINVEGSGYVSYGTNPAGYVKGVLYHMGLGTGAGWGRFENDLNLWYNVNPTHYYYGGEKYVDILHDIAQTALFSYSTDADGDFSGFVMAPVDGTSSQALNFDDAYNNEWAVGYTQPVNKVVVKSGWIESENKFTASVEVEGADYPSSKTETIEAYWIESGVIAKGHGIKIQRMYGDPLDQIVLEFEGSEWNNIASGLTVAVNNIPSAFPIKGSSVGVTKVPDYYIVSGKNYLREDDITQINLTRQIGGNWFLLNVSLLNGTDWLW